jgi:spore coat protein U-like protein
MVMKQPARIPPPGAIRLAPALLLLLACFSCAAQAQLACSLSLTPVVFDTIDSVSSGTYDARGSLTVNCTGSKGAAIAACVDLGPGTASANSGGQFLLLGQRKGQTLPIRLFQDAGLRMPWGSSALRQGAVLTRTGDGPVSAPVYARLYVQGKAVPPGTYSAQFTVALRYGTVAGAAVNCDTFVKAPSPPAHGGAIVPLIRKK